jgi:hypothetical protein
VLHYLTFQPLSALSDVGVIDVSAASVVSVFVPDDIAALDICIVSAMRDTTVWTTTRTDKYF